MSRIIVTGGSGRLGANVVASLVAAGHHVVSIDRAAVDGLLAEQIEHDLLDAEATLRLFERVKPEAVVHLAAISVPFSAPEREIFETNTTLALNVLDASVATGVHKVLVASSPTVIGYGAPQGWEPQYLPIDEEHPLAPWHSYSLSKQVVEEAVAMNVRAHGDGIRFGIFRPCYVIAPEEWAGAPTQQGHSVRERLDDPALSAVALFNYLDARDAGDFVAAWLAGADRVPNGTCFFVSAADSLATGPVDELLATHVPGTERAAVGLSASSPVFSSARAERLLGWTAKRSWRTELVDVEGMEVARG
jgi:nucleoside-diphosphate-sugar epimerase